MKIVKPLSLLTALLFSSCNFETLFEPSFNEPVKEFFETYTNTAAIETNTLSVESYNDNSKHICIDSTKQCEMTLYLRNPQLYTLIPTVEFNSLESIDTSNITIEQTSTETILLTLPEGFLADCDEGQNISPTVKLYEPMSGRSFETYTTNLYCNSMPPELNNATVLNNKGISFVIAFDMPSQAELALRHKDLCTITINNVNYPVSISDDGSFSFENSAFSTVEANYLPIAGKNFTYSDRSVYFETNETFSEGDKAYTITLTDTAGLMSSTLASTKITKLVSPGILDASDQDISAASITVPFLSGKDYNQVTITVPQKDHLNNDVPAKGTLVHYNLYNGTPKVARLYQSGTFDGSEESKTLQLGVGTWYIETYATKDNYEKSAVANVSMRVVDSNLYISSEGDDSTADGTKELPYKTFNAAVADLKSHADPALDYNIIISGALDTGTLDADFTANSIYIGKGTSSCSIENLSILSATPVTIENVSIKDLTLKNTASVSLTGSTSVTETSLPATAALSISGDVQISNLILKENAKLTIAGALTAEIPAVITPEKYIQGKELLAEAKAGLITDNWKKFKLTQNASLPNAWIIIHDGTLKEVTRLKTPDIRDSEGNVITESYISLPQLEGKTYNTIEITPPSQDVPGNTVDTEGTTVYYKLYHGMNTNKELVESGSYTCSAATPSKTFDLTTGTWRIEVYAEKYENGIKYYADSDTLSHSVRIVDSNIYISESGKDETGAGDGTQEAPFATLSKAITDIDERNISSISYNIYITGNIAGTDIPADIKASALNLTGQGTATVQALNIQTEQPVTIRNLGITELTVANTASVSLAGNIEITNAILKENAKLTIAGTLTAASNIKIKPDIYANGQPVLDGTEELISANYDKFIVEQNNEDTVWSITSEGKLIETAKRNISISVITQESDIKVSKTVSGSILTFTLEEGQITGCTLDGNSLTLAGDSLVSIDTSSWLKGIYDLYIEAAKDGETYSYHAQIEIK